MSPKELKRMQAEIPAAAVQQVGELLRADIEPRPLSHPLRDYHAAMTEGPLHYTWKDKPHRLVYDLIAAVRYYALSPHPEPRDSEIDALRNRARVAEETLARCREVLDATAASWREDVGQIDALRRDAERYRFLRNVPFTSEVQFMVANQQNALWDAAIDAALAAQGDN